MHIFRLFVTPRTTTSQESEQLRMTFEQDLQIPLTDLTIYERYDISGITESEFNRAKTLIFKPVRPRPSHCDCTYARPI